MPLAEIVLTAIADAVFGYAFEKTSDKLGEWAREKLRLDPTKKAFKEALGLAFKRLEEQHPRWVAEHFDASFFEHEGAPILAQFLIREGHPDASELAARWADSLNFQQPERRAFYTRELEPVAADFLEDMAHELKSKEALRELHDSRAFEEMTETLQALRQKLGAEKATAGTRRDYLRWLIGRNMYLDPRGTFQTQRQVQVKLDEVYISLQAMRDEKPRDVDRRILEQELLELEEKMAIIGLTAEEAEDQREQLLVRFKSSNLGVVSSRLSEVVELTQAVNHHNRLVILGDPGSGKTTLLCYLALQHAQALWNGRTELGTDSGVVCFPILVRIADYAEKGTWRKIPLSDFLANYCGRHECPKAGLPDLLARELDEGRCLVLLDGLDEIVSADDRRAVVRQIEDFVRRHSNTSNRFIITSRIAGYRSAPLGEPFAHFTVQEMDKAQIRRFLERWCYAVEVAQTPDLSPGMHKAKARQEIEGIMNAVQNSPGVRRLAANPLLLRTLALIHRTGAQLPQKRIELYKLAADTLARTWRTAQGVPESALVEDEYLTQLLSKLAYWLHVNKPTGIATEREVYDVLGEEWAYINDLPWNTEKPSRGILDEVKNFLRAVREHTGLFVERAPRRYGFMHLTFEEYYAARYLIAHSKTRTKLIRKHLHDARWNEPILLALGFVGLDSPKDAAELIETAILAQGEEARSSSLNSSPYEDILGWDYLFALRCLGDQIPASSKTMRQLVERLANELLYQTGSAKFWHYRQALSERLDYLKASKAAFVLSPYLVAALHSADPQVRIRAVESLGQLGQTSNEEVPALLKALSDHDPRVRIQVAESLGRLGYTSTAVEDALIRALHDQDPGVHIRAAESLGYLESGSDKVITALHLALHDSSPMVRIRAAESLGRQGKVSDEVMVALLKALQAMEHKVYIQVSESLGRLGQVSKKGIPALLKHLRSRDLHSRIEAMKSLEQLGQATDIVVDALIETLNDADYRTDPRVRVQAAESLGRLGQGSEKVIAAFLKALNKPHYDPDARLRVQVMKSLEHLGQVSNEVIAALLRALRDNDPRVGILAAKMLGQLGQASDEVIAALLKSLRDDPRVRVQAAKSLEQLGQASDEVIAALLKSLRDYDPRVRVQAAESLGSLGQASNEVVAVLLGALQDTRFWSVRSDAAHLLGRIGRGERQTIQAILNGLLDSNNEVRDACAQALAQLGQRFPKTASEIAEKLKKAIESPEFDKLDAVRELTAREYAFDALWMLASGGEFEKA